MTEEKFHTWIWGVLTGVAICFGVLAVILEVTGCIK